MRCHYLYGANNLKKLTAIKVIFRKRELNYQTFSVLYLQLPLPITTPRITFVDLFINVELIYVTVFVFWCNLT